MNIGSMLYSLMRFDWVKAEISVYGDFWTSHEPLIEFGRYAAERRARRGLGKPETFNFLGFTHICGRSSRGVFQLKRQTRRDRMRARLRAIKEELQRRMHEPIRLC